MVDAGTGWTEERVALLGRMWAEGSSASQIAAALGGGVTRNAVIGKVHRLGLAGRARAGQPAPARPVKPRIPAAPALDEAVSAADGPETGPSVLARRPAEAAIPVSERVTILDLRETMCRWPLGDPTSAEFGFCGGRSVTGLPYCAHHCGIAYQPAAERRRLRA